MRHGTARDQAALLQLVDGGNDRRAVDAQRAAEFDLLQTGIGRDNRHDADLARRQAAGSGHSGTEPGCDIGEKIVEHGLLAATQGRSEEPTSELQSLMRISYAVFCLN